MNRAEIVILSGIFFAAGAMAQTQAGAQAGAQANAQASAQAGRQGAQGSANGNAAANASANTPRGNAGLANGTALNASLDKSVDSKKAKQGETITAHTTEAVKENGKTVLPRGAKLIGHVTRASARANGDAESALAIQFDKAILKHGQEMPLDVNIQAIATARSAADFADNDMEAMGGAGGGVASSGGAAGRGALSGVTSGAGGTVGAVTNTAASTGDLASSAVDATSRSTVGVEGAGRGAIGGLNSAGQLTSNSRGVFGLHGLSLDGTGSGNLQGSVITSTGKNVHLDSGTKMLLVTQAGASAAPKP
jgi:hypothetical protein